MLIPMANPPESAGPISSGPRRRRSARREQGPPQIPPVDSAPTQPQASSQPANDNPAQPRVRLERLERKRARKPRRGSAEPAAAPADLVPGPNTREGRRSRHRMRGQQVDQVEPAAPAPHDTAPVKANDMRRSRPTHAEPNHVEPPARSVERTRDVENLPRTARDRRNELAERALRGLVTTRGTQVSWSAALRAREVSSPTAQDMAEAASDLVIVRRNYTPPEPLPTARKSATEQRPERPARRGQRQSGKGF